MYTHTGALKTIAAFKRHFVPAYLPTHLANGEKHDWPAEQRGRTKFSVE